MPGLRILLVEDDQDSRELLAEVLADSGHEVVAAATGAEGLRLLAERSIDVVVTDFGMPGMGGLEVARAAKAIAPSVPVVVITGYTEREDLSLARGREIDALVEKPFDPDDLGRAIAEVARGGRRP